MLLKKNSMEDISVGFQPPFWLLAERRQHGIPIQIHLDVNRVPFVIRRFTKGLPLKNGKELCLRAEPPHIKLWAIDVSG